MADDRKRKGDRYPGVTHPAVAAEPCPTCAAPRGRYCIVGTWAVPLPGRPRATRTHRTRINLWRVAQQNKRGNR